MAERLNMVQFEETAFRAAASMADKGALAAIALPDGADHVGWDVTRVSTLCAGRSRLRGRRELLFLHVVKEEVERAFEDHGRVAIGNLAAQQVLNAAELVVGVL